MQNRSIKIPVLIVIAVFATIGVYGIVALIVRLDDMGYKLMAKSKETNKKTLKQFGILLVRLLPWIIKALAVIGPFAMLVVAGGIYLHNIHQIDEWLHALPVLIAELSVGLIIGALALIVMKSIVWVKSGLKKEK